MPPGGEQQSSGCSSAMIKIVNNGKKNQQNVCGNHIRQYTAYMRPHGCELPMENVSVDKIQFHEQIARKSLIIKIACNSIRYL
ncbi:hypothetical protein F370042G1_40140 [Escherichia coli]